MAEDKNYNRLKGNVDRLEREIAYVNRGIKTSEKFVQGVDYSEELRAKSRIKLEVDKKIIKDLEAQLKEAKKLFNDIVRERRAEKGQEEVSRVEREYARLAKALSLQLDPESKSAKDIKNKIDNLVEDYASAISATQDRAVNKVEARAKLTKSSKLVLGAKTTPTPTLEPTTTPTPKPETKVTTGGTTGGNTGDTTNKINQTTKTPIKTPAVTTGGGFTDSQNAARLAQEATGGPVVKTYNAALAEVQEKYNLPDIIFSKVKSLGDLLDRYVNAKKYGKDGIADIGKFVDLVKIDPWYRANEGAIKQRYIEKYNYEDLVKTGKAVGNTGYEQDIRKITDTLMTEARGLGAAISQADAKLIAEDLYIHNQDNEESTRKRRLISFIRPMAGMIAGKVTEDYSGAALQNYQALQALAKRNGFKIENILPRNPDGTPATAQDILKRIALGEVDQTRLEQDVRKLAAVGQPQFVRDLLGQGIDLEEIYSPYRRTMANILELDESQIDLNDPTLRKGINEKGDMNLYDYEKALRQDSRWQYTGNARESVSSAALSVLRNFGFQG